TLTQRSMQAFPSFIPRPLLEIGSYGGPVRKVMRQILPRDSACGVPKNCVHDLTQLSVAHTLPARTALEEWFDQCPLLIREIGWVSLTRQSSIPLQASCLVPLAFTMDTTGSIAFYSAEACLGHV